MHTFQCAFCGSADDVSRPPQQPDACLNQRPQPPVPTVGHKLAAVDEKHRRGDEERRLGGEEQEDRRKLAEGDQRKRAQQRLKNLQLL